MSDPLLGTTHSAAGRGGLNDSPLMCRVEANRLPDLVFAARAEHGASSSPAETPGAE